MKSLLCDESASGRPSSKTTQRRLRTQTIVIVSLSGVGRQHLLIHPKALEIFRLASQETTSYANCRTYAALWCTILKVQAFISIPGSLMLKRMRKGAWMEVF